MSQVLFAISHLFPQSIRSHGSLKAKVQETFDEMKSKAEEEASRQRTGELIVWLESFIKGSLDAKLPSYELLKMLKVIDS